MEKVKHPAPRGRRKSERRQTSIITEKMDLTSPTTRPEPRVIVAAGYKGEGNGIRTNGTQKDLSPGPGVEEKCVSSQEELDEKKVVSPPSTPPSPLSYNRRPNGT